MYSWLRYWLAGSRPGSFGARDFAAAPADVTEAIQLLEAAILYVVGASVEVDSSAQFPA
jgi:hypothetical protein